MRRPIASLAVLLIVAQLVTSAPLVIYREADAPQPEGVRLNVKEDLVEISASEAAFVGHGYGGILFEPTVGMSDAELAALLGCCRFELSVDGAAIEADKLYAGNDGTSLWYVSETFYFDPGSLSPGIHILEGRWILDGIPCAFTIIGCDGSALTAVDPLFTLEEAVYRDGLVYRVVSHVMTLVVLP